MADENKQVKVIITFCQNRASVGIVQTDCDPVFFMKKGHRMRSWLPFLNVSRQLKKNGIPPSGTLSPSCRNHQLRRQQRRGPLAAPAKPKLQTPMF